MLKKAKQQKFISNSTATALLHLDAFTKTRDAEALHQFRVTIKKMKALCWLVRKHPDNDKLPKYFLPATHIFKQAGHIRAIDINRELISQYPVAKPALLLKMQQQRDVLAGKFVAASKKNKQRLGGMLKKVLPHIFKVNEKFITGKVRKKLRKISGKFDDSAVDPKEYHLGRKKIKALLYTCGFLPKGIVADLPIKTRYLDQTQKVIGEWHDSFTTIEFLAQNGYANSVLFQKLISDTQLKQEKAKRKVKSFIKKARKK